MSPSARHPGTAFVETSARQGYEVQFGPGDRLTHAAFELSGDAASDDALWSGLFELMQAGYLVVSEDGFVAAANGADVAGLAIDDPVIEHPATPDRIERLPVWERTRNSSPKRRGFPTSLSSVAIGLRKANSDRSSEKRFGTQTSTSKLSQAGAAIASVLTPPPVWPSPFSTRVSPS